MVKLLKYKNGKLRVVDYGTADKAAEYAAQGYIVEYVHPKAKS